MSSRARAATVEIARSGWDAWRADRIAFVTSPTGNLALMETRWFAPGEAQTIEAALAGLPPSVTATTIERSHIETGEPEHGIRLWDADAPAKRGFVTIDVFPFDPAWVIEATFSPVSASRLIPYEHLLDGGRTRDRVVPGDITFTLDGTVYDMAAFDAGDVLILVVGDTTNGSQTYGGGRFVYVTREPGAERVVLDFNRAFTPPCGFSPHFNCPLPPARNRFGVAVEAGEKLPVFADGHRAH